MMESQQMMELLLAMREGMKSMQEKAETDSKADREAMKEMRVGQEQMVSLVSRIEANQKKRTQKYMK
jgi:hypothetical protein